MTVGTFGIPPASGLRYRADNHRKEVAPFNHEYRPCNRSRRIAENIHAMPHSRSSRSSPPESAQTTSVVDADNGTGSAVLRRPVPYGNAHRASCARTVARLSRAVPAKTDDQTQACTTVPYSCDLQSDRISNASAAQVEVRGCRCLAFPDGVVQRKTDLYYFLFPGPERVLGSMNACIAKIISRASRRKAFRSCECAVIKDVACFDACVVAADRTANRNERIPDL